MKIDDLKCCANCVYREGYEKERCIKGYGIAGCEGSWCVCKYWEFDGYTERRRTIKVK